MAGSFGGNGSGKFEVHQQEMGGWIRVYTDAPESVPSDLPIYLSHSLTEWFRRRPELRLRSIVPIARDGTTVELHAWYDLHVFPVSVSTRNMLVLVAAS